MKSVITARSALFPGAASVEAYWQRILEAKPAPLTSFGKHWNLKQSDFFNSEGAVDRTYLDQAFGLPIDHSVPSSDFAFGDEERQIILSKRVLDDLLADQELDRPRTALVLGTSWSDAHYIAADSRMMVFGQSAGEARQGKIYDPAGQVDELSRHLGIGGPRFAVDTACASSLYALAAAERILQQGQADHIIVLGLNAYLPAFLFIGFSKIQAMSRTGTILPFSEDANGIVLGEGVGAILLEKRSSARKYGRKPLATVRAIGLSADGREGTVFTPGREGQKLAYERAYTDTLRSEIDYIEAHGTGTPLGDAAEIDCLGEFFQAGGVKNLALGSVKSLIGHSLAAAGIASIIKSLEMLRTKVIPPHISVRPSLRLKDSCLTLSKEAKTLVFQNRPMRVGINSLGFGGANAHVILEEWRDQDDEAVPQAPKVNRVAIVAADIQFGQSEAFPKRPDHESIKYPTGRYFSGEQTIDLSNLGLGPAQAGRLDPFLALLTHQTAEAYRKADSPLGDRTAIIACTNFGSEMALRHNRRFQANFKKGESRKEPAMTVEAITSTLPALSSGLAAASINLRGLHMTISGARDSFWNLLFHLHSWFDTGLDCILLSASTFIKSPYDLASRSGGRPQEASAAFALVPEHLAKDRALIWLDIIAADEILDANIDLDLPTEFDLGEVSGLDTIEALLKAKPGSQSLGIKRGKQLIGSLRLTRTEKAWDDQRPIAPQLSFALMMGRMDPPPLSATSTRPNLAHWHKELSELMIFAMESRARVEASLGGPLSPATPLSLPIIRRALRNIVITDPVIEGKEFRAQLIVDESHPYFFDHPLDHVPGILIFEASVQLAERFLAENPELRQGRFVAHASISFQRYTESQISTALTLTVNGDQMLIQAAQAGAITSLITLTLKMPKWQNFTANERPRHLEYPELSVLHKHKPENMLVARIEKVDADRYQAYAMPLSEGHFFHDGDEQYHSLVYLLEIARQSMMQMAHLIIGIPLGTPMNLVKLTLSLITPVPRQPVLIVESNKSKVIEADDNTLARIINSFKIGEQTLGQVEITAQVMKKEYYLKQRGKSPSPQSEGT